eukprot:m.53818 g.53818  ORF g.53818 m.53818 type:complete len:393 (+) comp12823_c0_seq2:1382-2560(+)
MAKLEGGLRHSCWSFVLLVVLVLVIGCSCLYVCCGGVCLTVFYLESGLPPSCSFIHCAEEWIISFAVIFIQVWVISQEQSTTDYITRRLPISAERRSDFPKNVLHAMEEECGVKLDLFKRTDGSGRWELQLQGPAAAVDTAEQQAKDFIMRKEREVVKRQEMRRESLTPRTPAARFEEKSVARTSVTPPPVQLPCQMVPAGPGGEWAASLPLHPDWAQAHDPHGRPYYYHKGTSETTWDRPIIQQGPVVKEEASALQKAVQQLKAETQQQPPENGDEQRSKRAKQSSTPDSGEDRHSVKREISATVVRFLTKFRKKGVKYGYIATEEDFKHLARKFTHTMVEKISERRGGDLTGLAIDESLKTKIADFIRASMKKCGAEYQRAVLGTTALAD